MMADHLEQSLLQLQKRQVEFHIGLLPIVFVNAAFRRCGWPSGEVTRQ